MGSFNLINLGYKTLINKAAVQLFRSIGVDFTRPNMVQAKITNQCNSRCNMCDVWRRTEAEIPASIWINTLTALKDSYGKYKVSFTGGEVFLKNDAFKIFEFCNKAKIPFGITTNGYLLNPENYTQLLKSLPLNINVSIDSLSDDNYERIRGVRFLDTVKSNLDSLIVYIKKNSLKTKVFLKTVVNSYNLNELHSLVKYAMDKKVAGITFDPIKRKREIFQDGRIKEFEKMFDIDNNSLDEAKRRLIGLKRQGYCILNSEENIKSWLKKYNNCQTYFCDAPLLRINIDNKGQIKLCDYTESYIGNIIEDDIRVILKSRATEIEKNKLTHCIEPCEYCIQRNLNDYFRIFLSYLRN